MSGPMRTKVISAWDFRQGDVSAFCVPFEADRELLAESLLFLRKKYARRVPAERIEAGDIATLRCRSEKPRFQKESVAVNVGKRLFSKELEEQLPGLAAGEERELAVKDTAVSVRALNIERIVLPELTDGFVERTFPDLHSYADLEAWYIEEQLENHIRQQTAQAVEALQAQALAGSRIQVDETERLEARANGERIVRDMWNFNGHPLDQMSDEEAQEILGYPTVQDYIDWFAGLSEDDLSCAALGWELLAAEGRAPTEDGYREALRRMTEEEGLSPEEQRDYTFPAYVRQICAQHYHDTLEEYAYQIIKEKLL